MLTLCLLLILISFAIAVPATMAARALGRRMNALDAAGVPGQIKAAPRRVPNTGGIGIFLAVVIPVLLGLAWIWLMVDNKRDLPAESLEPLRDQFLGIRKQTPAAIALVACVAVLHLLGLLDDRRPLGPYVKLLVMLGISAAAVMFTDSRLLTMLDARAGGPWLSIVITVLWIGVITNAFNFLDNMDGLSAGVGAICAAFFLVSALVSPAPQWFVAAMLALLLGALLGFLVFNFPWRDGKGASVFMGDGGSLILGFLLGLLSVRITYVPSTSVALTPLPPSPPHAFLILTPLIILAIPLYDFCSVTLIRLSQGKSPFVGDLRHFSHRLVNHGLSRRAAVLVIYGCTAVTGIGAVSLPRLSPWQAALVGVQTLLVLCVIALYEWSRRPVEPSGS